jgi:hypothetical protein
VPEQHPHGHGSGADPRQLNRLLCLFSFSSFSIEWTAALADSGHLFGPLTASTKTKFKNSKDTFSAALLTATEVEN